MPMILVLLRRTGREGKVHQMSDGRLPLPIVWILHAAYLSLCILIHSQISLPAAMLRLALLLFAGRGVGLRVAAGTSAPPLAEIVGEVLLSRC